MKSRLFLGVLTYMSMVLFLFCLQLRHEKVCQHCTTGSNSNEIGRLPDNTVQSMKPRTPVSTPILKVMSNSPTLVNGTDINANISKFFAMESNEQKDTFVNLHRYKFRINSDLCSKRDLFLIMIVHSAPHHFSKRTLIRTTYGSVQFYKGKKMAVVFMLGAVYNKTTQGGIDRESKRYDDIVQGNFQDTYRSLIRKHIMDMHWFKYYCNANFILKLDDDTFVNPFRVVEYILNVEPKGATIHCEHILRGIPGWNPGSKWHTPKSQYPFPVFPQYCRGFAYITTPEIWTAMYMASKSTRMMNMDDVYVSAVLGLKIQVNQIHFGKILYSCRNVTLVELQRLNNKALFLDPYNRCEGKAFMFWKELQDLNRDVQPS